MSITIQTCPIEGLNLIQPKVFNDDRGYFLETWNERDLELAGIPAQPLHFVQDNQSKSTKGVLRGLHCQKKHPQGKLVRAISGEVFDVAVDLRNGSSCFGKWYGVILSGEIQNQFYLPPGFAHGFLVLSKEAIFAYKCTDFYYPGDEIGIRWNDPVIGIDWPSLSSPPALSDKDVILPAFDKNELYF